ncbi:unnamed protein product [Brassicogethes aeneus]|uniref:Uncharacterized protein n=1 Tax=Brassicogethes aeneus TaxID=1431903 RepID=A0A9P0FBM8_BRAAE|nr:unnamed protein product [Brassicogethes aeneus]
MSTQSDVILKQSLRKIEYPLCAKEALGRIVELICGRITSIKHMDLALDLMAEFIFYEVDRRGNKRPQIVTPLQELQLLEIMFEYFNSIPNEAARNSVFLSLFSGTTAMMRSGILSKLISIAVGVSSPVILLSASTWMQQLGCLSANSCKLAEALVHDYFYLIPNAKDRLKTLPDICPQFTANFLTAVAENYYLNSRKDKMFPPKILLEVITMWISENSSLCISAQQKQAALPPGAIAMEVTTPIAGLLRWCILAPLYNQESELYCHLHLALLNSILEIPQTVPAKAIYAQHTIVPISYVMYYVNDLKNQGLNSEQVLNDEKLQLALDRYAQAIQVALSMKAVYGHVDDLLNQLQHLPYNKLLNIVVNTHKRIK